MRLTKQNQLITTIGRALILTALLCFIAVTPGYTQSREQLGLYNDSASEGIDSPPSTMYNYLQAHPNAGVVADTSFPNGKIPYGKNGQTNARTMAGMNPGVVWPEIVTPYPVFGSDHVKARLGAMNDMLQTENPMIGPFPLTANFAASAAAAASVMEVDAEQSPEMTMQRAKEEQNQANQTSADTNANMERQNAGSALDYVAHFLFNFTTDGGNIWNRVRNELFIPMAILILLPGAILAQVKAIVAAGSPVIQQSDIASPFDGVMRAIIAIFLIPATYLFVNYGIDVANSITKTIADEYQQIFGTDMYQDAMCAHIRAFPVRNLSENKGYIPAQIAQMGQLGPNNTPLADFEGNNIEVKLDDPCAGLNETPADRTNEQVSYVVNSQRNALNTAGAGMAMAWNILCAFQQAYLYYLWFVGPVVAALWVYPMPQLRQAFPNWMSGVATICFWSLFWNTVILLTACLRGVDETGTLMVSALNFLTTASVKFAFDFAGLAKEAGMQAAQTAQQMGQGGGGGAGKGGASGGQGAKGAQGAPGSALPGGAAMRAHALLGNLNPASHAGGGGGTTLNSHAPGGGGGGSTLNAHAPGAGGISPHAAASWDPSQKVHLGDHPLPPGTSYNSATYVHGADGGNVPMVGGGHELGGGDPHSRSLAGMDGSHGTHGMPGTDGTHGMTPPGTGGDTTLGSGDTNISSSNFDFGNTFGGSSSSTTLNGGAGGDTLNQFNNTANAEFNQQHLADAHRAALQSAQDSAAAAAGGMLVAGMQQGQQQGTTDPNAFGVTNATGVPGGADGGVAAGGAVNDIDFNSVVDGSISNIAFDSSTSIANMGGGSSFNMPSIDGLPPSSVPSFNSASFDPGSIAGAVPLTGGQSGIPGDVASAAQGAMQARAADMQAQAQQLAQQGYGGGAASGMPPSAGGDTIQQFQAAAQQQAQQMAQAAQADQINQFTQQAQAQAQQAAQQAQQQQFAQQSASQLTGGADGVTNSNSFVNSQLTAMADQIGSAPTVPTGGTGSSFDTASGGSLFQTSLGSGGGGTGDIASISGAGGVSLPPGSINIPTPNVDVPAAGGGAGGFAAAFGLGAATQGAADSLFRSSGDNVVGDKIASNYQNWENKVTSAGGADVQAQMRNAVESTGSLARSPLEGTVTGAVSPAGATPHAGHPDAGQVASAQDQARSQVEQRAREAASSAQAQAATNAQAQAAARAGEQQVAQGGSGGGIFGKIGGDPAAAGQQSALARQQLENLGDTITGKLPDGSSANPNAVGMTVPQVGGGTYAASSAVDAASAQTAALGAAGTGAAMGAAAAANHTGDSKPVDVAAAGAAAAGSVGAPATGAPAAAGPASGPVFAQNAADTKGGVGSLFGDSKGTAQGAGTDNSGIVGAKIAGNYQNWENKVTNAGAADVKAQMGNAVESTGSMARNSLEGNMTGAAGQGGAAGPMTGPAGSAPIDTAGVSGGAPSSGSSAFATNNYAQQAPGSSAQGGAQYAQPVAGQPASSGQQGTGGGSLFASNATGDSAGAPNAQNAMARESLEKLGDTITGKLPDGSSANPNAVGATIPQVGGTGGTSYSQASASDVHGASSLGAHGQPGAMPGHAGAQPGQHGTASGAAHGQAPHGAAPHGEQPPHIGAPNTGAPAGGGVYASNAPAGTASPVTGGNAPASGNAGNAGGGMGSLFGGGQGQGASAQGGANDNSRIVGERIAGNYQNWENKVTSAGGADVQAQMRNAVEATGSMAKNSLEGSMTGSVQSTGGAPAAAPGGSFDTGSTSIASSGVDGTSPASYAQQGSSQQSASYSQQSYAQQSSGQAGTAQPIAGQPQQGQPQTAQQQSGQPAQPGGQGGGMFASNEQAKAGAANAQSSVARESLEKLGDTITGKLPDGTSGSPSASGTIIPSVGTGGTTSASGGGTYASAASGSAGVSPLAAAIGGAAPAAAGGNSSQQSAQQQQQQQQAGANMQQPGGNASQPAPNVAQGGNDTIINSGNAGNVGGANAPSSSGGVYASNSASSAGGTVSSVGGSQPGGAAQNAAAGADNTRIVGDKIASNYQNWENRVTNAGAADAAAQVRGAVESNQSVAKGSLEGSVTGSVQGGPTAAGQQPAAGGAINGATPSGGMSPTGGMTGPAATQGGVTPSGTTQSGGTTYGSGTTSGGGTSYTQQSDAGTQYTQSQSGTNYTSGDASRTAGGPSETAFSRSSNAAADQQANARSEVSRQELQKLGDTIGQAPDVRGGSQSSSTPTPGGLMPNSGASGSSNYASASAAGGTAYTSVNNTSNNVSNNITTSSTTSSNTSTNASMSASNTSINPTGEPAAAPNPALFGSVSKNRAEAVEVAKGNTQAAKSSLSTQPFLAKTSASATPGTGARGGLSVSKLSSALGRAATNTPTPSMSKQAAPKVSASMPPRTVKDPLGSVAAGTTLRRSRMAKRKASQQELEAMEKLGSMTVE